MQICRYARQKQTADMSLFVTKDLAQQGKRQKLAKQNSMKSEANKINPNKCVATKEIIKSVILL